MQRVLLRVSQRRPLSD